MGNDNECGWKFEENWQGRNQKKNIKSILFPYYRKVSRTDRPGFDQIHLSLPIYIELIIHIFEPQLWSIPNRGVWTGVVENNW